jgi:hypothetical protein
VDGHPRGSGVHVALSDHEHCVNLHLFGPLAFASQIGLREG